jgi:peptidyl-tRNA hydrolase, PTH1 family
LTANFLHVRLKGSNKLLKEKNMDEKFLIIGLGNPGREYRNTRHNVGFMIVDNLAHKFDAKFTRIQFNSLLLNIKIDGNNIYLAKPQTYMNNSDQAVLALIKFYKIELGNLIICNDDLDLPLGTLRIRGSGGSGGQKGINSIIEGLGTKEFPRLRMGIGRPPGRMDAADYVLKDFSQEEQNIVADAIDRSVEAIMLFIEKDIESVMTKYN